MRRPKAEPTLSIYRNPDRELLFHGDEHECRQARVRVKVADRELVLRGIRYRIVQQMGESDGSALFWVVNL